MMGANLSPDSESSIGSPATVELLAELDRLRVRIEILEAERDEYAQQNAELFVLQQVFSAINSTLDINDILSMVLRGVVQALKFSRAILFDVVEDGSIVRRLECNSDLAVVRSDNPYGYRQISTLHQIAAGESQLAYGYADDDDCPLDDTRRLYCAAPLVARDVIRGVLYADDAPGESIGENQLRILLDFASQAAIAIENARLYEETRRLLEETQRLANTDSLTGIPNRRAFNDLLERELASAERYDAPLAFAILDVDDLKRINDTGGHSLGDLALRRFAQILTKNVRRGDIIARYAGDEFVMATVKSDREAAMHSVERVLVALRRNGLASSIGVAMYPDDGRDAATLFFAADQALYQAKLAGKNQYRFFDPAVKPDKHDDTTPVPP